MYLEFLVVLCLISLFLAVLLPQLARARSVARRTQCLNNLKNVSLALQSYSDAHGTYPPGYIARNVTPDSPASDERGPGWGWAAMTLVQLEQQGVYRAIDFRLDVAGATTAISAMLCPDDQSTPFTVSSDLYGLVSLGPSSFVGVAGCGSLTDAPGRPSKPGIFYRNSRVRVDDVADGLSNTFLLGERRAIKESEDGQVVDSSATWVGAVSGAFREPGYSDRERLEGPGTLVLGVVGQIDPFPLKIPPNGAPLGMGFSSHHEGGAHFSRADGACSFISDEIDVDLFMRLGQRDDGEPASWP